MSKLFEIRGVRIAAIAILLLGLGIQPQSAQATPPQQDDNGTATKKVVIELFYRSDSDQSLQSKQFLEELQKRRSGIEVKAYDMLKDKPQLKRLLQLTKQFGHEKPGLPTFYLCNTLQLGFRDAQTTGAQIEDLLTIKAYVRQGCKHCAAGKKFLDSMMLRYPALRVQYHDVISDFNARNEVQRLASLYRIQIPSFPCIRAAGRLFVGYQTDEISGSKIEDLFIDRSVDLPEVEKKSPDDTNKQNDAGAIETDEKKPSRSDPAKDQLVPLASVTFPWMTPGNWSASISYVAFQSSGSVPGADDLQESVKGQPEQDQAVDSIPVEVQIPDEVLIPDDVELPDEVPVAADDRPVEIVVDSGTSDVDPEDIQVPVFGSLSVSKLGLPAFTFLIGLVDGFNPCAMWVLVFLLSVLVNIKERKKIILVAGTFVIVSGLAYFTFMAAWFNVFQLIGLLRPVQIGLGVMAIIVGAINVKDFFAFHQGVTLSIPESAKPGIYKRVRKIVAAKHLTTALFAAVVLAIVVNIVELLCTAGLPALYTEVLTMQKLPMWANYSYLGLYILAYMLDDTILVGIVVMTLSHRRLQESEGRWLKLLSGVVILVLGMVMILWPEILV